MAKSVSSIYDNIENLVPFYPDVVYCQSTGRPPEWAIELDKRAEDAMFLSRALDISFEQVLRWFRGDATNPECHECEGAMKRQLANCEENEHNRLMAICRRYSLSIVGETICSLKTSSPSSEVEPEITAMKQVRTTNARVSTHLTQEVQVEVSDEKEILHPSRDASRYWQWYCDSWDDFVRSWFDERRGNLICTEYKRIVDGYKKCVKDLNCDELPEPYQGNPKSGVDAVVLNLNPGMSQKGHYGSYEGKDLEATKFYSNIEVSSELVPSGWLIKKFRDEAKCSYRDYLSRWSCLNPKLRGYEPEVCGVDWWQGSDPSTVDGRMKWVRQIYGKDQLCPSRVFAPEICPFHSKSFPTDDFQELNSFIGEHVIVPTMMAVIENKLPFAVAIGKTFAILLEKIGSEGKFGIAAKLEKEWWDESENVEDWQWPEARDNKTGEMRRVHRKYCLFALKDKNGRLARFLVCAAPGINGTPGGEFGNIEKEQIIPYIKCRSLTNEWYEQLKPVKLRWWNYTGKKGMSLEKPKLRLPQAQQDMPRGTLRGGSMTQEQHEEVLQMLRNKGIAGCRYQAGSKDFILFSRGTVGNFFIKENTRSIGFYGVEPAIMREWADKRLRSFIEQNAIFNGWRLDVKKTSKSSPKGMWFSLRVDTHGWYDHREEVVAVAVALYNELQRQGILADDFTASKFKQ